MRRHFPRVERGRDHHHVQDTRRWKSAEHDQQNGRIFSGSESPGGVGGHLKKKCMAR
jgi:hypothetical protein